MNLRCKNCGTSIEVPPDLAEQAVPRVQCPTCGSRYRLKARSGTRTPEAAVTGVPATPTSSAPEPADTGVPVRRSAPAVDAEKPPSPTVPPPSPTVPPPFPAGARTGAGAADQDALTMESAAHRVQATPTHDASRRSHHSNVLETQEVLAGRYRIRRFLAQGGMGEVYEAEDLELRENVALKTIGGHAATSKPAIERFKREIHLARKVTHPNVCRIFDLGQHLPRGTPGGPPPLPLTFLTMELLQGETLSKRLRREGRFTTDQALPIARQIAEALGAAHGAGVVHRDLKSENVFVDRREGEEPRVVVTDFGVARGATDDNFASMVTGAGIVGTPAYMAPEQVEGGTITPSADVYAFGVVLYEMVTGRLPFESDNPLTTAVKRLREPPPPPHLHVPHLEARWERVILRCLARDPADRYPTASEAVLDLEKRPPPPVVEVTKAEGATPPTTSPPPDTGRKRRLALELLLLGLLAVLAVVFWTRRFADRSLHPRSSIAVLGFKNSHPEQSDVDWMSTALSEMLSTELARSESLRTIPGETVARARRELEIELGDSLAPDSLRRVRSLLGCDYVVLGSFLSLPGSEGQQLRVDLKLQDAVGGETFAFAQDGSDQQLFTMVDALGAELRAKLGLEATADRGVAAIPRNTQAARLYAQALDALRSSRPEAARELLVEAIEVEPDHPLLHSTLSQAWQALGYARRAAESATRAFELASGLPEQERLLVEGRFHESQQAWGEAIEVYDSLWERYPDNLEYGLRLAAAQTEARAPAEALETVREIRALPEPLSQDPRIDLAEAAAAALLSDFDRQLGAAQKASGRARELGADLLLAQARLAESQAWRLLGRAEEAGAAAREAIEIHQAMGDPSGEALATSAAANVQFDLGELDKAAAGFLRAIELYESIGDRGSRAFALNNLALILKRRGDYDEARARYEEAEETYSELDSSLGLANTLNNLASLWVDLGRLGTAREMFERSLKAWEAAGNRHAAAFVQNNIGVVLRLQGRLEEADEVHRRTLETRRQLGHKSGVVNSLANLAGTEIDRGNLDNADELLSEARDLATEIEDRSGGAHALFESGRLLFLRGDLDGALGDLQDALDARAALEEGPRVTDTRLELGRLQLARGDIDEAEVHASLALGTASAGNRPSEEALALALLARVASERGELASAQEHWRRADDLTRSGEQPAIRWRVELAGISIATAHSPDPGLLDRLGALRSEIEAGGHVELTLETRLAEAAILMSLHRVDEAREDLIGLQADASLHGAGLISQRAGAMLAEADGN